MICSMKFLLRLSFETFVEGLAQGSTVYCTGFIEADEDVVLLTSDGGIENGPIHVLRMRFASTEDEGSTRALVAVRTLLKLKGMIWSSGVLLTQGLSDAIREFKNTAFMTHEGLEAQLAEASGKKEKVNK